MIKLELTVDEVNFILNGIGSLSYSKVFLLIDKIQRQAAPQVEQQNQLVAEEITPAEEIKE